MGWDGLSVDNLVVPLDTQMFRVCKQLGLTERKQPKLKTVLEITAGCFRFMPLDAACKTYCYYCWRFDIRIILF